MKSQIISVFLALLMASACSGFLVQSSPRNGVTQLFGTFDGKAPRITVRDDEDAAMWVDEPAKPKAAAKKTEPKKAAPVAKKAPAKKAAPAAKPASSSFKMPWQK